MLISFALPKPLRFAGIVALATAMALLPPASADAAGPAHLVLGGEDDEEGMLFSPEQVEEGPDGSLYVLDTGDSYIKVYAPNGDYRYRIGGEGEGPGRFQHTDGATFGFIGKDRIYFTEYYDGHHWLTIMKLNGAHGEILAQVTTAARGLHLSEHFLLFFTTDDDGAVRAHTTVRPIDEVTAPAQFR